MVKYYPGDVLVQIQPRTWLGRLVRRVLGGGKNSAIHTEIISLSGLSVIARPLQRVYEDDPDTSFEVYRHPIPMIAKSAAHRSWRFLGKKYGYWIALCTNKSISFIF